MTQDPHDPDTWEDGEVLDDELLVIGAAVDAALLTHDDDPAGDPLAVVELRLIAADGGALTAYLALDLVETITTGLRESARTARAMRRAHRRGARP
jgi:hypothetical protein